VKNLKKVLKLKSADGKKHLFVYKIHQTSDIEFTWKIIHLEPENEKILTTHFNTRCAIYPLSTCQMYDNEKGIFITKTEGISRCFSISLIDFGSSENFCTELAIFPIRDFFQVYLRNVVQSLNFRHHLIISSKNV
jgi:hypothetical protein